MGRRTVGGGQSGLGREGPYIFIGLKGASASSPRTEDPAPGSPATVFLTHFSPLIKHLSPTEALTP